MLGEQRKDKLEVTMVSKPTAFMGVTLQVHTEHTNVSIEDASPFFLGGLWASVYMNNVSVKQKFE